MDKRWERVRGEIAKDRHGIFIQITVLCEAKFFSRCKYVSKAELRAGRWEAIKWHLDEIVKDLDWAMDRAGFKKNTP